MKQLKYIAFALGIASAALFTACETESADELVIEVSPSYTHLSEGQSVTLKASGGWNYRWSLDNGSYGQLSATQGGSVQYTAKVGGGVSQTITVIGMGYTGGGSSDSNKTNTASSQYKATATIVQGTNTVQNIKITPSSKTLKVEESVTLTASGGQNYRWSLAYSSYGQLSATEGTSVKYTAKKSDVSQTITVLDNDTKKSAIATIEQIEKEQD